MHIHKNKNKIISTIILIVFLLNPIVVMSQNSDLSGKDADVQDLAQQLKEQREAIEKIQEQVGVYEQRIQAKRNEALNIKNQLSQFQDKIDHVRLELELKRAQVTEINLKIKETEKRIQEKDAEILAQRDRVGEFIKILYQNSQKNYIEILLANDAFSEFFDQQKHLATIEADLSIILKKIKIFKEKLELEHKELRNRHQELEALREQLTNQQLLLEDNITAKNVVLEATQADEAKFQSLLQQVRAEQAQINATVTSLERALRAKLEQAGDKTLSELSGQGLIWPVPSRVITATFHDPRYPFRRYFEHPGIDIRARQGTEIKAAASGYVSRAHDAGMGYSYVSIIHADGLSTVYGHVSCILVSDDEFVVQGQGIACSGGTPGTPGAGNLTTGPHLHFEVRLNGIPVNPVNYLP